MLTTQTYSQAEPVRRKSIQEQIELAERVRLEAKARIGATKGTSGSVLGDKSTRNAPVLRLALFFSSHLGNGCIAALLHCCIAFYFHLFFTLCSAAVRYRADVAAVHVCSENDAALAYVTELRCSSCLRHRVAMAYLDIETSAC